MDESSRAARPDGGGVPERVAALTYAGEEPTATLPVRDGCVVATTHRLLVYTPEGDGANLRAVEAPNVVGFAAGVRGRPTVQRVGVFGVLAGLTGLVAGRLVDFESPADAVPTDVGVLGVGGLFRTIAGAVALLTLLDEALTLFGAVALLAGGVALAAAVAGRRQTVVVAVAGGPDVQVPAGRTDADDVRAFAERVGVDYSPPSFRMSWPR